jgi:hypothetical protein
MFSKGKRRNSHSHLRSIGGAKLAPPIVKFLR